MTAMGPINPYLADSWHPIAHVRCDQQDSTDVPGPTSPSGPVAPGNMQHAVLGPCHFGSLVSPEYPGGRRVIWSNGRHHLHKLDDETFEVLASLRISDDEPLTVDEMNAGLAGLDGLRGEAAMGHAIGLALRFMTGLDGVYALVDCDNTVFVSRADVVVAWADADPSDPASPIIERGRWERPAEVTGAFVGMNMTFDGRLVLSTDEGWMVCLERDFSAHWTLRLPGAEVAAAHNDEQEAERGHRGYGWVRTSLCVDDGNGIYVNSVDHLHKVVWTGERLSLDEADGGWRAPYRNGNGAGSGTTPCLMGFGDEDRFVVIGDGDAVVNITLMWRDAIPEDWEQLPDAPSRRIAGLGRADMGDPARTEMQTEQSITVCGYGAMTVNNEPSTIPEGFAGRGTRMLAFFLGHHAEYRPHGMHKFEWKPASRTFEQAWVNTDASSPNSVPFVSSGSDMVYTCGTRNERWTIEAVDWTTGESRHSWEVGGSRFNTLGAGVNVDDQGRLLFGNIFGKTRLTL